MTTGRLLCLFVVGVSLSGNCQENEYSLDSLVALGKKNHPIVLAARTQLNISESAPKFEIDDPQILFGAPSGEFFTLGVSQDFSNPISYSRQKQVRNSQISIDGVSVLLSEAEIEERITSVYSTLLYRQALYELTSQQDSIYNQLYVFSKKKYESDEGSLFDMNYAESNWRKFQVERNNVYQEMLSSKRILALLCGLDSADFSVSDSLYKLTQSPSQTNFEGSLLDEFYNQQIQKSEAELRLQRSNIISGFSISYMNQGARDSDPIYALQVSVSVPLWFGRHKRLINQKSLEIEKNTYLQMAADQHYKTQLNELLTQLNSSAARLSYYESSGLPNSEILVDAATRSYEAGEMDALKLYLILQSAYDTRMEYLQTIFKYNKSLITLTYLTTRA